jgi:XapX domain-containing protein
MKILIGLLISFLVGAGCRFFDIPSPSPPVLPGAILVVAMTFGYTFTDSVLKGKNRVATTKDPAVCLPAPPRRKEPMRRDICENIDFRASSHHRHRRRSAEEHRFLFKVLRFGS